MSRIKRGVTAQHRHKRLMQMTKGHRGGRHNLYRRAKESLLSALSHAYRHRRQKKGEMRRLWITRINAAARECGLSYSQLIHGLNGASVSIDRKILADIAIRDFSAFTRLADIAREEILADTA